MTEEPANLVLEYPRRIDGRLDRIEGELQDVKLRLGALETNVAHIHTVLAIHSNRFDKIEARLTRIEKRLDPVEVE